MAGEIVKTEDVMETFDKLDEHQAIAELKGEYLEQYVYSFKDKGVEVKGLSLMGVRETAREMNKRGFAKIAVSEREPIVIETDNYIEVRIYAKDDLNGGGYWGIKRQQKFFSTGSENRFAIEQALSKAQRNAIRGLISEPFVKEMIAEYLKRGLGVTVNTGQVVETIKDRKQIATITTQPTFDRSKQDSKAKPKTKINPKTNKEYCPTVARLYSLSSKVYGLGADDFHKLCLDVTGKEHSKDYTNQDCWDIEDEMIKRATDEVEKMIAPDKTEFDDIEKVKPDELEDFITEKFEMK